ncbi:MAG: NGG1p interacting factor NIF3 [Syntrophomonadaceae bacterium]|nr:NGG1p interacting factor NIF3 [Syntrophomonadaceae bacterium]
MKLGEIYREAVRLGIENDPRGTAEVDKVLEQTRKEYEEAKEEDREAFDQERLVNPYSDTRILYGGEEVEVRLLLAGIDVEVGELLLADRLRERGKPIDLVLSHHPEGKALAALGEVMHLQEDVLYQLGIPINVAEGILANRIKEVHRSVMPLNHNRPVDAARLLELPLMCVHTPADNLVTGYLSRLFVEKSPRTVGEVVKILREIPEYRQALRVKAGPQIVVGADQRRAGKVFVDMTGGTSGSEEAYSRLAQAGVGTIVGMHMPDKHRQEAEKNHLNVVIAGHLASDSIGLNLFLDHLEEKGVSVLTCSGLIRVRRF